MVKQNRRDFLKSLGSAAASTGIFSLLASLGLSGCGSRSAQPNFLIFLSDDLGYGDLACYGNPINRTPHLDRFAREGVRFTDCHAAGTVCSPSRASLLTGRHPYRLGLYYIVGGGAHLRREEISIATLLQEQGYDTCFVGKWHMSRFHNRKNPQPHPGDHGFDHWFATEVNAFEGPRNPQKFVRNGEAVGEVQGWYCDVIVQEALSWLENRRDSHRPFFLLVCSHEPHTPLAPPAKYADMYDTAEVDKLEASLEYGHVPRTQRDISHLKKHYYGTITQLDAAFGALMQGVDRMGYRKNTLVFFTSDNGPEDPVSLEESRGLWEDPIRDRCFGTPGPLKGMKRFPYEGGHRVPGIIRWPGEIPAGVVSDAVINGTDVLPTLCALSGAPLPRNRVIDGTSMVPAFSGKALRRQVPLCWIFPAHEDTHFRMPHMAMREDDYVLIGYFRPKEPDELIMDWIKSARLETFELYNLAADIAQSRDLSRSEPDRLEELKIKMRKLWKEIQAEGPIWKDWKMK